MSPADYSKLVENKSPDSGVEQSVVVDPSLRFREKGPNFYGILVEAGGIEDTVEGDSGKKDEKK